MFSPPQKNGNFIIGGILKDWPQSPVARSHTPLQHRLNTQTHEKAVTFSEASTLYMFPEDPKYKQIKSYTRAEQEELAKEALSRGELIRRIISSIPGSSNFDAIKQLLEAKIVLEEDVLGLEVTFLSRAEAHLLKEYLAHSIH
eukprot:scaffold3240_cov197-Alexandrium_tamarense.AAC.38